MSAVPGRDPADSTVAELVADLASQRVASRIAARDADLWGPEARAEAAQRLGWTRLPETSRALVDPIVDLRRELSDEGVDRVVLCGMGGSSLAPEVICATAGVDLVVLDSTDPGQVAAALVDLERTVVVVSSKSGTTVETDSQRRAFASAFEAAGIDPATRLVVVTDPGSPLEEAARGAGYRAVFTADPEVGGRYSALSAFGLVPSGLAGADVAGLLDAATAAAGLLSADSTDNPALALGAAVAATPGEGGNRDKLAIVARPGDGLPGFGDWAEQLLAESTGKSGRGVLPVAVGDGAPEIDDGFPDCLAIRVAGSTTDATPPVTVSGAGTSEVTVTGSLGGQFLLWEYATAIAGRALAINPFDQPDVESAKAAARRLLDAPPGGTSFDVVDGDVAVAASPGLLGADDTTVDAAVRRLLGEVAPRGYVALMAYLDRGRHAHLAELRDDVARRTGRPTTFGWGPRFLHSTGQYHKGGPPTGVFVQVVAGDGLVDDLDVPGRDFTFGRLVGAQAAGDARVLAERGLPVLTLAVRSEAGVSAVVAALRGEDR